jgi:hypothetical protein
MTTEEFKNYLINYFVKKKRLQLYKVFKQEYDKHEYYRRRWGTSRPKNK